MKKVLFIIPAFNHGGTNRSLFNIVKCLQDDAYQIDIFAMAYVGPYKEIFSQFNILKRDLLLSSVCESYSDRNFDNATQGIVRFFLKFLFRVFTKLVGKRAIEFVYQIVTRRLDNLGYDTVVAMQEGSVTHFAAHLKTKKIAWVHCDYSEYQAIVDKDEGQIYSCYYAIICVSDYTKGVFLRYYPALEERCHSIHNVLDSTSIFHMADDTSSLDTRFNTSKFTIVSIGRFSKVKQFDIVPRIAHELRTQGCAFTWYLIGNGEEYDYVQRMIEQFDVAESVVLLGEKDNPYPYIKRSDLLVCTSISEACPYVINEAKVLHVPVVTTNFGSASEFIKDRYNGLVSSQDTLQYSIALLMKDTSLYSTIRSNIQDFVYSNGAITDKLANLL